jgi:TRAP-type C4-dicarboxylate transport system permease small subunit
MDWNRTLSSIVACLYVGAALFALLSHPSADAVLILLMACLFVAAALAMIWYGEDWGGPSVGVSALGIDRGTPGCFVVLGGWLLLLIPVLGGIAFWLAR